MSAPDAKLSAAERAALADIEAAAVADDPHLAARLKGAPAHRLRSPLPLVHPLALRLWRAFLQLGWWGAPIAVAGFVLMALGLSVGLPVSLLGAVAALGGLRLVAEAVDRRRRNARRPSS